MLPYVISALLSVAMGVLSAPQLVPRDVSDTDILNFALNLEYLEAEFYNQAAAYSELPSALGGFKQSKQHAEKHVAFLANALGDAALQPCTYQFPHSDPKALAAVATVLETVGAPCADAVQLLENQGTVAGAASIPGIESCRAAWAALASQFVASCPAANAPLMADALPPLTVVPNECYDEVIIMRLFMNAVSGVRQVYIVLLNGDGAQYSDLAADGSASVPAGLRGPVFAGVVADKASHPTLLTGLAMLNISNATGAGNP